MSHDMTACNETLVEFERLIEEHRNNPWTGPLRTGVDLGTANIVLAVVDQENRLVGIVTVDDAIDVMREEATEDFEKLAGMTPTDKPYLRTGGLLCTVCRGSAGLQILIQQSLEFIHLGLITGSVDIRQVVGYCV